MIILSVNRGGEEMIQENDMELQERDHEVLEAKQRLKKTWERHVICYRV